MRRKYSTYYNIEINGLWWIPEIKKWESNPDYLIYKKAQSWRRINNLDKALRVAISAMDSYQKEVEVTQWFFKKGKRYCKRWIYQPQIK